MSDNVTILPTPKQIRRQKWFEIGRWAGGLALIGVASTVVHNLAYRAIDALAD